MLVPFGVMIASTPAQEARESETRDEDSGLSLANRHLRVFRVVHAEYLFAH